MLLNVMDDIRKFHPTFTQRTRKELCYMNHAEHQGVLNQTIIFHVLQKILYFHINTWIHTNTSNWKFANFMGRGQFILAKPHEWFTLTFNLIVHSNRTFQCHQKALKLPFNTHLATRNNNKVKGHLYLALFSCCSTLYHMKVCPNELKSIWVIVTGNINFN